VIELIVTLAMDRREHAPDGGAASRV